MADESGDMEAKGDPLFIFYDSEAANGNVYTADVIEIAAKCHPMIVSGSFEALINTKQPLGAFASTKCGLSPDKLAGKAYLPGVMARFLDWVGIMVRRAQYTNNKTYYPVICAHGGYQFDFLILFANLERAGVPRQHLTKHNLHFGDTFHFCSQLQESGEAILADARLSMDGLFSKFFPKDRYKDRHRAMGDVEAMVKIFTKTDLKNMLHKMSISTTNERVQYFINQSSQKTQGLILEEKLSRLDACTRNMATKRLLKEGITYDVLQKIFQQCCSFMDFWQFLKGMGIERKVGRVFASQFGAMGLQNQGALAYHWNDGVQDSSNGSSSDGSSARKPLTPDDTSTKKLLKPQKCSTAQTRNTGSLSKGEKVVASYHNIPVIPSTNRATSSSHAFEQRPSDYAVTSSSRVSESTRSPSQVTIQNHNEQQPEQNMNRPHQTAKTTTKHSPETYINSKATVKNNTHGNAATESHTSSNKGNATSSSSETDGTSEDWDGDIRNSAPRADFKITFTDIVPVSINVDDLSSPVFTQKPILNKAGKPSTKQPSISKSKPIAAPVEHDRCTNSEGRKRPPAKAQHHKEEEKAVSTLQQNSQLVTGASMPNSKLKKSSGQKSQYEPTSNKHCQLDRETMCIDSKVNDPGGKTGGITQETGNKQTDTSDGVGQSLRAVTRKKKEKRVRQRPDLPCVFPEDLTKSTRGHVGTAVSSTSQANDSALKLRTVYVGDVAIFVPLEEGYGMCNVDDENLEHGFQEKVTEDGEVDQTDTNTGPLNGTEPVICAAVNTSDMHTHQPKSVDSTAGDNAAVDLHNGLVVSQVSDASLSSCESSDLVTIATQQVRELADVSSSNVENQEPQGQDGEAKGTSDAYPAAIDPSQSNGGVSEMEWDGYGPWLNTEANNINPSYHLLPQSFPPQYPAPYYPYRAQLPVPYGYCPPVPPMMLPHHPVYPAMAYATPQGFVPYRAVHPGFGMPYLTPPIFQTVPTPVPTGDVGYPHPVMFNQVVAEPQHSNSPDVLGIPVTNPVVLHQGSFDLPGPMAVLTDTSSASNSERSSPYLQADFNNNQVHHHMGDYRASQDAHGKTRAGGKQLVSRGERSRRQDQRDRQQAKSPHQDRFSTNEATTAGKCSSWSRDTQTKVSPRDKVFSPRLNEGKGKKSQVKSSPYPDSEPLETRPYVLMQRTKSSSPKRESIPPKEIPPRTHVASSQNEQTSVMPVESFQEFIETSYQSLESQGASGSYQGKKAAKNSTNITSTTQIQDGAGSHQKVAASHRDGSAGSSSDYPKTTNICNASDSSPSNRGRKPNNKHMQQTGTTIFSISERQGDQPHQHRKPLYTKSRTNDDTLSSDTLSNEIKVDTSSKNPVLDLHSNTNTSSHTDDTKKGSSPPGGSGETSIQTKRRNAQSWGRRYATDTSTGTTAREDSGRKKTDTSILFVNGKLTDNTSQEGTSDKGHTSNGKPTDNTSQEGTSDKGYKSAHGKPTDNTTQDSAKRKGHKSARVQYVSNHKRDARHRSSRQTNQRPHGNDDGQRSSSLANNK